MNANKFYAMTLHILAIQTWYYCFIGQKKKGLPASDQLVLCFFNRSLIMAFLGLLFFFWFFLMIASFLFRKLNSTKKKEDLV